MPMIPMTPRSIQRNSNSDVKSILCPRPKKNTVHVARPRKINGRQTGALHRVSASAMQMTATRLIPVFAVSFRGWVEISEMLSMRTNRSLHETPLMSCHPCRDFFPRSWNSINSNVPCQIQFVSIPNRKASQQ